MCCSSPVTCMTVFARGRTTCEASGSGLNGCTPDGGGSFSDTRACTRFS